MDTPNLDPQPVPQMDTPARPARRVARDELAIMLVVGVAVGLLSFQTWVLLAEGVGFTTTWTLPGNTVVLRSAWLLGVSVDAFALASILIWRRGRARLSAKTIKMARRDAIGAIALSVVAQGVYHGMAAAGWVIHDAWVLVVLVGGIPPLLLAAVVHLYQHVNDDPRSEASPAEAPQPVPQVDPTPAPQPVVEAPQPVVPPLGELDPPRVVPLANWGAFRPAPERSTPQVPQHASTPVEREAERPTPLPDPEPPAPPADETPQPPPPPAPTRKRAPKKQTPAVRLVPSIRDTRLAALRKAHPTGVPTFGQVKATLGIGSKATAADLRRAIATERGLGTDGKSLTEADKEEQPA